MQPLVTITDLSQIRQLELYLELRQLGVLMSSVAELFPTEIQRAAEHLSGWPSVEKLGISHGTIAHHSRAIKAMEDAQETGALTMDPLLRWDLDDERRYAEMEIGAERLKIVSEELDQLRKRLRKDKHNSLIMEEGKYRYLVKKFIIRHFEIYGGPVLDFPIDSNIEKRPRKPGGLPKPSDWKYLTITFTGFDEVRIKVKDERAIKRSFANLKFADRRKGGMPNDLWGLLRGLAFFKGELTSDNPLLESNIRPKTEKQISRIRARLRRLFNLKTDPLPWIKREKNYRCSFQLRMDDHVRELLKERYSYRSQI